MTKKNFMPVIVLAAICVAVALIMGVVNMLTYPRIEAAAEEAANAALKVVLPEGKNFEEIELSDSYPDEVTKAYKADGGYVFRTSVSGNKPNVVVMCGIDESGKIVGVEVVSDEETPSYKEKIFPFVTGENGKYNGEDLSTLSPEIASGATKSSQAIYNAVRASLNAYAVATGGEVQDAPVDTPITAPDITTPVISRTDAEIYNLAKEFYDGNDVEFEMVELYQPDPTTVKVFKYSPDNNYILYLATRTQYTPLETEALILVDGEGWVLDVNLLTWTVGHGVEVTPEYLNSFVGKNKYSTDEIELVSQATSTSNNLVTALENALRDVFGSVAMTDAEIEKYAAKAGPLGDKVVKMDVPDNAPETVKAMFKLESGRGYVFYTVTSTQYTLYETEAFIYTDINGKVMNLYLATWTVGHGVEATDDFINGFKGITKETIEDVELISGATTTSQNLANAVKDALSVVPEHINYSLIAGIVLLAAALSVAGVIVYVKVVKRRKRYESK